jgi:hypothetical protein
MVPIPISLIELDGGATSPDTAVSKPLEVFIPFANMRSAQASILQAERLCSGLNVSIRVVRVIQVPYPLALDQPAVACATTESQMAALRSSLPLRIEIWLSREPTQTLLETIPKDALVLLSHAPRFWRTQEEKLACALRKSGRQVLLVSQTENNHA